MSIYWDLHCRTCDRVPISDGEFSNKDILRAVYRLREAIVTIYEHGNYLDVEILGHHWDHSELWRFLAEHKDHALELLSENGDIEPVVEVRNE